MLRAWPLDSVLGVCVMLTMESTLRAQTELKNPPRLDQLARFPHFHTWLYVVYVCEIESLNTKTQDILTSSLKRSTDESRSTIFFYVSILVHRAP